MGLLTKKTDEERAAERAEKELLKAEKAAEAARKQVELQAAAQREQELYAAYVAELPKWEYRVLTNTAMAGWGGGKVHGLDGVLNSLANEGWRVISMSFTGQIDQFLATDKNHLYVVLERARRGAGHAGHPVTAIAS